MKLLVLGSNFDIQKTFNFKDFLGQFFWFFGSIFFLKIIKKNSIKLLNYPKLLYTCILQGHASKFDKRKFHSG